MQNHFIKQLLFTGLSGMKFLVRWSVHHRNHLVLRIIREYSKNQLTMLEKLFLLTFDCPFPHVVEFPS
jgi:hypothetical protein